jgi:hypothetical protein
MSFREREAAMTALALAPMQPDESDINAAVEALPHVKDYLATHTDSVIRLVVADDPEDTLIVPRIAVELLARYSSPCAEWPTKRCQHDPEPARMKRCTTAPASTSLSPTGQCADVGATAGP